MTLRDQALFYKEPRTERTREVSGFGRHRLLRGYAACAAPCHSYDAIVQRYLTVSQAMVQQALDAAQQAEPGTQPTIGAVDQQ
jgi:hypothetical protein